jgi:hypothetical protein
MKVKSEFDCLGIITAISESFFGDCILNLLSIPDRPVDTVFFIISKVNSLSNIMVL